MVESILIYDIEFNKEEPKVVWSFGGGAVKWISLAEGAKVSIEINGFPDIVIGVSAGALLAPIIAVAKKMPGVLNQAIQLGSTLNTEDMFPYKDNNPFTKKGRPTVNAIFRLLGGWNHLGWQDIAPLYKKVFTEKVFEEFKKSDIKCYAFGVRGKDFSPKMVCLNDAKDVDDLIAMIELSSRIIPFVQPAPYEKDEYIDGGFIANNAAWTIIDQINVKELITFYTSLPTTNTGTNDKWSKNILQITSQGMQGMAHWHSVKDRIIEELYCKLHGIDYMCIEYPCSAIDQVYDTDDDQLKAVGKESREITRKAWNEYLN